MLRTIFRLRTFQFCPRKLQVEFLSLRSLFSSSTMAKSKFEYVREFESHDICLPNCFIVVRVDGKGFHKFTEAHGFEKPNDREGLLLMSKAAARVMEEFNDISCAYGQSDEFSFVFNRDTNVYKRRTEKILSVVNSLFTSSYVFFWDKFISRKLKYPPAFDARIVLYPTVNNLRDYLSWRQADAHINNLYNTAFWGLVKAGKTKQEAEQKLCGTVSSDKHEILFKTCSINYNNECELYKKGTMVIKKLVAKGKGDSTYNTVYVPLNCDIIQDKFWNDNPQLLNTELDTPVCREITEECQLVFVKTKITSDEDVDSNKKKTNKKKNRNPQRRNHGRAETNGVKSED
uniref:Probable tRNA(His) guanylyltransferase n=1 Tax=Cacopsylla melanoneura TaxID=428564 RepID=A0A8D8WDC1_9HEMI